MRGDQPPEGLDQFLEDMDLGDPDPTEHLSGPQNPVELAEWFANKKKWFVDDEGFRDWLYTYSVIARPPWQKTKNGVSASYTNIIRAMTFSRKKSFLRSGKRYTELLITVGLL